jgi:chemotaxis protein MotB
MADAQPPIIIVRKKGHGHGHHGGAWKLAYADLVTAMMAFFLVMWIIGLDVNTKQGIAAYFNNPGSFRQNTATSRNVLKLDGRPPPMPQQEAENDITIKYIDMQWARTLQLLLEERRRTDPVFKNYSSNVHIVINDQGLQIDLIEDARGVFFPAGSDVLSEPGKLMMKAIVDVLSTVRRPLLITGHIDQGRSQSLKQDKMRLALNRAQGIYGALVDSGYSSQLCRQVTSRSDFVPRNDNPDNISNSRVAILLPFKAEEQKVD